MINIDPVLEAIIQGVTQFRNKYPNGAEQIDIFIGIKPADIIGISFYIHNVSNREVMYVPGNMSPPTRFTLRMYSTIK